MKNCRLNDSLCRISVRSIIKAAVAAPKIKIVTCRIRSPSLMRPSLAAILFGSTCTHACTHTEKFKKGKGKRMKINGDRQVLCVHNPKDEHCLTRCLGYNLIFYINVDFQVEFFGFFLA